MYLSIAKSKVKNWTSKLKHLNNHWKGAEKIIVIVSDNGAMQVSVRQMKKSEVGRCYILISPEDESIGMIDFSKHYLKYLFETGANKFYEIRPKKHRKGGP